MSIFLPFERECVEPSAYEMIFYGFSSTHFTVSTHSNILITFGFIQWQGVNATALLSMLWLAPYVTISQNQRSFLRDC